MTGHDLSADDVALIESMERHQAANDGTFLCFTPQGVARMLALARRPSVEAQYKAALTPSAETKVAYIWEFYFDVLVGEDEDGNEVRRSVSVPWTTIKEIMAAIARNALNGDPA